MTLREFGALAALDDPPLDELALALAAEFRPVEADEAMAELDRLGSELSALVDDGGPETQVDRCRELLGERHGFVGDRDDYDNPRNSMLDVVLARRRGLPILLSVVYVEVSRRAGIPLAGVGLPGHYVVGHFGTDPPLLIDPFAGGVLGPVVAPEVAAIYVRPWRPHETALRILTNLTVAYSSRADFARAIRAAELRLALPIDESTRTTLTAELRSLHARFN
jgi:regulator of sirC expression with transglutaminase-like and TPR domain